MFFWLESRKANIRTAAYESARQSETLGHSIDNASRGQRIMFCSSCGIANVDGVVFCKSCGAPFLPFFTSSNRLIAAFLSLLIPGLGQAYLGRPGALRWFIKTIIGYVLFIIPGLVVHALCIFDAISVPKPK